MKPMTRTVTHDISILYTSLVENGVDPSEGLVERTIVDVKSAKRTNGYLERADENVRRC